MQLSVRQLACVGAFDWDLKNFQCNTFTLLDFHELFVTVLQCLSQNGCVLAVALPSLGHARARTLDLDPKSFQYNTSMLPHSQEQVH